MEWILYSNVGVFNLSGKDSASNSAKRTQVPFEAESFPLKYQHTTFEYKIHSIEVDLYYFKYL